MADVNNEKLIGLLVIAGGSLLLSQAHIKEMRKQRQWVRPWIRKRDSKRASYSIKKQLAAYPLFLYCLSGHFLSKSSLQLMLVLTSWNSENKKTYSAQVRLHFVLIKKIISVYWIKSYWLDFIHYTETIVLSKNLIFLYTLKIFFTMLRLKILEYWIICTFSEYLCVKRALDSLVEIYWQNHLSWNVLKKLDILYYNQYARFLICP